MRWPNSNTRVVSLKFDCKWILFDHTYMKHACLFLLAIATRKTLILDWVVIIYSSIGCFKRCRNVYHKCKTFFFSRENNKIKGKKKFLPQWKNFKFLILPVSSVNNENLWTLWEIECHFLFSFCCEAFIILMFHLTIVLIEDGITFIWLLCTVSHGKAPFSWILKSLYTRTRKVMNAWFYCSHRSMFFQALSFWPVARLSRFYW